MTAAPSLLRAWQVVALLQPLACLNCFDWLMIPTVRLDQGRHRHKRRAVRGRITWLTAALQNGPSRSKRSFVPVSAFRCFQICLSAAK